MSKYHLVLVAAVAAIAWTTTSVAQENRGTPEQRTACTPDAFRLCSAYIPDATRVELCLRQNKSELSEACRSVFAQSEATPASARK